MDFLKFRAWFDERFLQVLHTKVQEFTSLSESVDVASIISYITVLAQDGKRFRPFLVYSASGIRTQEECDRHFLLFASVELLHIFALIHDDIMDQADTRHGVVCAHKKFIEPYGDEVSRSIGILLGDVVFAWAYECLLEYTKAFPEIQTRMIEEYTRLVREVTHGQLLDVLSPVMQPLDEQSILTKITLKTARYSFVQPLRVGFILAGDTSVDHIFTEDFGLSLGTAFQLQDDLLDSADSAVTGKTRFLDMQSGQQTLLSWYMYHKATPNERNKFIELFGKKELSQLQGNTLYELLISSGAYAYVQAQSEKYFSQATDAIEKQRTDDAEVWFTILGFVKNRKK